MKSLPEFCDECSSMVPVGQYCFVRLTKEVKPVSDVTFKESVCGVWCEDCYMVTVPEEPNPHER